MTQSSHDQGAPGPSGHLLPAGWGAHPDPGLIAVGKIKAGMEAFAVPGAIKATIE